MGECVHTDLYTKRTRLCTRTVPDTVPELYPNCTPIVPETVPESVPESVPELYTTDLLNVLKPPNKCGVLQLSL